MLNVIRGAFARKKGSKPAAPAVLSVAILAFILAMALLPLATPGVAAQDDDPKIKIPGGMNGTVLQQETPVPEIDIDVDTPIIDVADADDGGDEQTEDPPADEQAGADGSDDPREESDPLVDPGTPVPGGDEEYPHHVGIYKHACPVGFDAYQADFAALAENCVDGMPGVTFDVVAGDQVFGSTPTIPFSNEDDTRAVLGEFGDGSYAVVEHIPQGYGTPIVFCKGSPLKTQPVPADQPPMPLTQMEVLNGNQIAAELGPYGLSCQWYNVPAGGEQTPDEDGPYELTVHKQICPFTLAIDPYAADLETLRAECGQALAGVDFMVMQTIEGSSGADFHMTDDDGLLFQTIQAPMFDVQVYETLPDGYGEPIVFCGAATVGGGDLPNTLSKMPVFDGLAVGFVPNTYQAGDQVYCDWFNVPSIPSIPIPDGDDGNGGDSSITVTKTACPIGFDAYGADIYGLVLECQTAMADVPFLVSDGNQAVDSGNTDGNGFITFGGLVAGPYSVVESVPDGYGEPVVYCETYSESQPNGSGPEKMPVDAGNQTLLLIDAAVEVHCNWFNVPTDFEDAGEGDSSIHISKTACPAGYDAYNADIYDLVFNCQEPMADVPFGVSDGGQYVAQNDTDANGFVSFLNLAAAPYSIVETVPAGYGEPVAFCETYSLELPNGSGPIKMSVADGNQIFETLDAGVELRCNWFNIPVEEDEPGSVTVYKYTCPAGYGPFVPGADPAADCTELTDGIIFLFGTPGNLTLQSDTGDSIPGAVYFGGLAPGTYDIYEQVPAGIEQVFVTACTGSSLGQIQNYPLSIGATLTVEVASGDEIVCHWYNVPEAPTGTIVLTKHFCEGEVYVDAVYCEIYENGIGFELLAWAGNGWFEVANGTTDGYGTIVWSGLQPGSYVIEEIGGTPCYITSTYQDAEEHIAVVEGTETHVDVYNCGVTPPVTKKPVKYPNTGVAGPVAVVPDGPEAPISPAGEPAATHNWIKVLTEWWLRDAVTSAGMPASIRAESVAIDAEIEVLEIVNGELQDPTTADQVAWYKDTARLGGSGNVVMAGHLNYWGVPEGVFFRLDQFQPGDRIEVTAANGMTYTYEVEWVQQVDAFAAPGEEILGQTEQPSLTLITCGGEWDANVGLYNERTVVRAVLMTG